MSLNQLYDLLFFSVSCFFGMFVMSNMTHKKKRKNRALKHLFLEGLSMFKNQVKNPAYTC